MKSDIQLIHGDCLEKLKDIPDSSIDLVLADPPYQQNVRLKWDKIINFDLLWPELERVTMDTSPIVLMGNQPFTTDLINSKREWFRYEWVWDKHMARGMNQAKFQPMRKHENIIVFSKVYPHNYYPIMVKRDKLVRVKNYTKNNKGINGTYVDNEDRWFTYTHKNPTTIIEGCWEANRGKIHPTQKAVSLMEYLIKTYSLEGETVLDFCTGSASTAVAAYNTNRKFIGIEKDETYFNLGVERVKNL
jgi:site-specific DNA-methyltransferase (adenine-specific)